MAEFSDFSVVGAFEQQARDIEEVCQTLIANHEVNRRDLSSAYLRVPLASATLGNSATGAACNRICYYDSGLPTRPTGCLHDVLDLLAADTRAAPTATCLYGLDRILLATSIFEDSDLLGTVSRSQSRFLLSSAHLAASAVDPQLPVAAQVYGPSRGSLVGIACGVTDPHSYLPLQYVTRYKSDSLPLHWRSFAHAISSPSGGTGSSASDASKGSGPDAGEHNVTGGTASGAIGTDPAASRLTSPQDLLSLFCSKLPSARLGGALASSTGLHLSTVDLIRTFSVRGALCHTWTMLSAEHHSPPRFRLQPKRPSANGGAATGTGAGGPAATEAATEAGQSDPAHAGDGVQPHAFAWCDGMPRALAGMQLQAVWSRPSEGGPTVANAGADSPAAGSRAPLFALLDRSSSSGIAYRDVLSCDALTVRAAWAPGTTLSRAPRLWEATRARLGNEAPQPSEPGAVAALAALLAVTFDGQAPPSSAPQAMHHSGPALSRAALCTLPSLQSHPLAASLVLAVQAILGAREHRLEVSVTARADEQAEVLFAAASASGSPRRRTHEQPAEPPMLTAAFQGVSFATEPDDTSGEPDDSDDAHGDTDDASDDMNRAIDRELPEEAAYAHGRRTLDALATAHARAVASAAREARRQQLRDSGAVTPATGGGMFSPSTGLGAGYAHRGPSPDSDRPITPVPQLPDIDEEPHDDGVIGGIMARGLNTPSASSPYHTATTPIEARGMVATPGDSLFDASPHLEPDLSPMRGGVDAQRLRKRDRLRAHIAATLQPGTSTLGGLVTGAANAGVGAVSRGLASLLLGGEGLGGDGEAAIAAVLALADDVPAYLSFSDVDAAVDRMFASASSTEPSADHNATSCAVPNTCSPGGLLSALSHEVGELSARLVNGSGRAEVADEPTLLRWLRLGLAEHISAPRSYGEPRADDNRTGQQEPSHSFLFASGGIDGDDHNTSGGSDRSSTVESSVLIAIPGSLAHLTALRRVLLHSSLAVWASFVGRLRAMWERGERLPFRSTIDENACLLEQKLQLLSLCSGSARDAPPALASSVHPIPGDHLDAVTPSTPARQAVLRLVLPEAWLRDAPAPEVGPDGVAREDARSHADARSRAPPTETMRTARSSHSGSSGGDAGEIDECSDSSVPVAHEQSDQAMINLLEIFMPPTAASDGSRDEPQFLCAPIMCESDAPVSHTNARASAPVSHASVLLRLVQPPRPRVDLQPPPPATADTTLAAQRLLASLGLGTLRSPHRCHLSPAVIQSDMAAFQACQRSATAAAGGPGSADVVTPAPPASLLDFFRWYFPSAWEEQTPVSALPPLLGRLDGATAPITLVRPLPRQGGGQAASASAELLPASAGVLRSLRRMEGALPESLGGAFYRWVALPGAGGDGDGQPWALKLVEHASDDPACTQRAALWASLWAASPPLAASSQRPLHDPRMSGELALDWLETLTATELCAQLLAARLGGVGDELRAHCMRAATGGGDLVTGAAVEAWCSDIVAPVSCRLAALTLASAGASAPLAAHASGRRCSVSELTSALCATTVDCAGGAADVLTHSDRWGGVTALLRSAAQSHGEEAIAALATSLASPWGTVDCGEGVMLLPPSPGLVPGAHAAVSRRLDDLQPGHVLLSGVHAARSGSVVKGLTGPLPQEASRLLSVGAVADTSTASQQQPDSAALGLQARRAVCELLHHYCSGGASDSSGGSGEAGGDGTAVGGIWAALARVAAGNVAARGDGAAAYSDRSPAPLPHEKTILLASSLPRWAWGAGGADCSAADAVPGTCVPGTAGDSRGGASGVQLPEHRLFARIDSRELRLAQAISELY